ncbi:hypothetical protein Tco_1533401 [Tanacetum coccineum]
MRKVNTFVPIESEGDRAVPELAAGSSKRDAEEELDQESFDRDDLVMLWSLVKETFNLTEPKMHKEKGYGRLYDSCGVHHVSIEKGIDIYMLVEKEYPLSRGTLTLMCSKDLGGTRYECPEIFLGRYSCRLKTKKDEVFGRILLENKMRSKQSRVINDLRSYIRLHNWYHGALDLGSYKVMFCVKSMKNEGMDKSKITRKQSKTSKHGHENQKSTKPKPKEAKPQPKP